MPKYFFVFLCILLTILSFSCKRKPVIKEIISTNSTPKNLKIDEAQLRLLSFKDSIADLTFLTIFYKKNELNPYWLTNNNSNDLSLFRNFIDGLADYGLNSDLYDQKELLRIIPEELDSTFLSKNWNTDTLIQNDIKISNSLIKLIKNLYAGEITNPLLVDSNWFHPNKTLSVEYYSELIDTLHQYGLQALIKSLNIDSKTNKKLRQELIALKLKNEDQLRQLIEDGETIKPEGVDVRLISIRQRLYDEDLLVSNDSSLFYDSILKDAIIRFQKKYNLIADGVIGKSTIDAMNIPVSKRMISIIASLERYRWLPFKYPEEHVIVNIPSFNLKYIKNDSILYSTKAIVGRTKRQTPAFTDSMTYVELNPFWTIPPTILEEDVIPHILKDNNYLASKNIRVLSKSGVEMHPDSVDWKSVNPKRVPFKLKKDPGPSNDLGRVKFMFPNKHMIYFHDTPSKYLFASNIAAHSSGCIRIQDPFDFAKTLFKENEEWGNDKIVSEIKKGKNKIVKLDHPIPVFIIYQTVWVNENDEIIFGNDIYKKDEILVSKLHYQIESINTKSREIIKPDSVLIQ